MIVNVLETTARTPYSETENTLVNIGKLIKEAALQMMFPQK